MFHQLLGKRVLVVGDAILDRYTQGNVGRVSPEAPVPVIQVDRDAHQLGGAASVARLLRHLQAEVTLAGVVGTDGNGHLMKQLLEHEQINDHAVLADPSQCTTSKQRIVGETSSCHPHQIVRVDRETNKPLSAELESRFIEAIQTPLREAEAVLVSDYGKGVCTPRILGHVIQHCCRRNIPAIVDPARNHDWGRYRGASVIKPNRDELKQVCAATVRTIEDAKRLGSKSADAHDIATVLITLDKDGMVIVNPALGISQAIPADAREVYDITGAGDTVLAVLGLCLATGFDLLEAAQTANTAAGLQVEHPGIATLDWIDIFRQVSSRKLPSKVVSLRQARQLVEAYRRRGRRIVLANGCFDLLHVGHVRHLQEAALLGDALIVAVNSDAGVRALKGPARPLIDEENRAAMLSALTCVDHVLIFNEEVSDVLVRAIQPDVLVKGGTYSPIEVVGREIVENYGGRICLTRQIDGMSTTALVNRIRGLG